MNPLAESARVSSRLPLVVRALTLRDVEREIGANVLAAGDLPAPLAGFRMIGVASALGMSRGTDSVWLVAFAKTEMRALGRSIASGAMIGPLQRKTAPTDLVNDSVEDAYRALFDYVLFALPAPPNVISARVLEGEDDRADVLWRLALAIDGRAVLQRDSRGARVDIFRAGRRAALASALSFGLRGIISGLTIQTLAVRPHLRFSKSHHVLLVLAREVRAPVTEIAPGVTVRYDEATEDEVQRHPLRFGLGLYLNRVDPSVRRHFVGRVDGQVGFRMALNFSAPVLDRMVLPSMGASLASPVALVSQCATEPSFRGLSIYPAALQWLAQWAGERGVRTLVVLIEPTNTASLRGAAKAGFKRVGEVATQR